MFKKISSTSNFGVIETENSKELISVTSNNKVVSFKYDPENFVYFRCRAITADVPNANADFFPEEEVKKSYKTFIGVGLYKDHNADSINKAIGKILWAEYIPDGKYVELIGCIDKKLDPDTARRVTSGIIDSCSMGCSVTQSECSICGNIAYSPKEYCEHINPVSGMKGRILSNGKMVYEINRGIQFTELSLVTSPADKTARLFEVVASKKITKQAFVKRKEEDFFENSKSLQKFDEAIKIYKEIQNSNQNPYKLGAPINGDHFDKKLVSQMLQFFFALNHPIYKLAYTYRNITDLDELKKFGELVDSSLKKLILSNIQQEEKEFIKEEEDMVGQFTNEFSTATSILNANGIISAFPVTSNSRDLFLTFANYSSPNKHFYVYKNYVRNGLFITLPGLLPFVKNLYYKYNPRTIESERIFRKLENVNMLYYNIQSIGNRDWVKNDKIINSVKSIYNYLNDYFEKTNVGSVLSFDPKYLENMLLRESYGGLPYLCEKTNSLIKSRESTLRNILDFLAKFKTFIGFKKVDHIWGDNFSLISDLSDTEKQYISNFGISSMKDKELRDFYSSVSNRLFNKKDKIEIEKLKKFLPKNFGIDLKMKDKTVSLISDAIINVDFLGLCNYARYYNRISNILLPEEAKDIKKLRKTSIIPEISTINKYLSNMGNSNIFIPALNSTIKVLESKSNEYYVDFSGEDDWVKGFPETESKVKHLELDKILEDKVESFILQLSEDMPINNQIKILKNIYDIISNSKMGDEYEQYIINKIKEKTKANFFLKERKNIYFVELELNSIFGSIRNLINNNSSIKIDKLHSQIIYLLKNIKSLISYLDEMISNIKIKENFIGYTPDFVKWLEPFGLGYGDVSKAFGYLVEDIVSIIIKSYSAILEINSIFKKNVKGYDFDIRDDAALNTIKDAKVDIKNKFEIIFNILDKYIKYLEQNKDKFSFEVKDYSPNKVPEEFSFAKDVVELGDAIKKSIPKDKKNIDEKMLLTINNAINDFIRNINILKYEIKDNNKTKETKDFFQKFIQNILLGISELRNYRGIDVKIKQLKELYESFESWDKKSSLYLKKDIYIEGSLKFFYVKGEGFRSSKIICKQGNKAVRTSLYNILPADVMLDIVENENTKFSPEDLVSVLNKKFSSIEEFSQWVKRSFKDRRK